MGDVGVEGLRPCHSQDDRAQSDEGGSRVARDEGDGLHGGQRHEDARVADDVGYPHARQDSEPGQHDRAEDLSHLRRSLALGQEKRGQDRERRRDDVFGHMGKGHLESFDGGKDRYRGGDD